MSRPRGSAHEPISTFSTAAGATGWGERDLSPEGSAVIRAFLSLPAFLLSIKRTP